MERLNSPEAMGAIVADSVSLGANVSIGAGAVIIGNCVIGDDCVIGAGAVLDPGTDSASIIMEDGSRVMASATIAAPATIGRGAIIHPGTVVVRNVPPYAIVSGNPAQIVGYTTSAEGQADSSTIAPPSPGLTPTSVRGVNLHRLPKVLDLRGNLTVGEFQRTIPFDAKRYFMVFGVPNAEIRGEHAHRTCHQFLICAHGTCSVVADDGDTREEFLLSDPSVGLHLPPLVWGIQYKYSPDAVLLVFTSEYYDPGEYIRNYGEFCDLAKKD